MSDPGDGRSGVAGRTWNALGGFDVTASVQAVPGKDSNAFWGQMNVWRKIPTSVLEIRPAADTLALRKVFPRNEKCLQILHFPGAVGRER